MGDRWRAGINVHNEFISLGLHDTEEEAAVAYDRAALQYFGEAGFRNFERK